jgi:HD superfamily phosphodiesterase
MNFKNIDTLITEAQEYLTAAPQDSLHDYSHHERVLNLAKMIVADEKLEKDINTDILNLICWWHDVQVPSILHNPDQRIAQETAQYVSERVPKEIQEVIFDSIKEHEFGLKPQFLEGKVLQDADKLEVLSTERLATVLDMVASGERQTDEMLKLHKMVTDDWLPIMPSRYHFTASVTYHKLHVSEFEEKAILVKNQLTELKR